MDINDFTVPVKGNGNDFKPLRNDLVLRAFKGERIERTPIWLIRQGLYSYLTLLPSYDFFAICKDPRLAAQCTVDPVKRFGVDCAVIFTDFFLCIEAFGFTIKVEKGLAVLRDPLVSPDDLERLARPMANSPSFGLVYEALFTSRVILGGMVPLLGILAGPFTLMTYMIEGRAGHSITNAKQWLFKYGISSHYLLQRITDLLVAFSLGQVNSGAQAIQVFDISSGELSFNLFNQFALPYLKLFATKFKQKRPDIPLLLYTKPNHFTLSPLSVLGFDVLSVDWSVTAKELVEQCSIPESTIKAFQGNLDPAVLLTAKETINQEVKAMMTEFGIALRNYNSNSNSTNDGNDEKVEGFKFGYIANLGVGLDPAVSEASILEFVSSVHENSLTKLIVNTSTSSSTTTTTTSVSVSRNELPTVVSTSSPSPTSSPSFIGTTKWIKDESVNNCLGCSTLFTLINRKHHCRRCGLIFCSACSSHTVDLGKGPVRICDNCFTIISVDE